MGACALNLIALFFPRCSLFYDDKIQTSSFLLQPQKLTYFKNSINNNCTYAPARATQYCSQNTQQNKIAFYGAISRKSKEGRKWVVFGVIVKDGWGWMQRTWTCSTGGSRRERKSLITPGDARTSTNPTCGPSARLLDSYSSYVCDFVILCFFAVIFICFLPAI